MASQVPGFAPTLRLTNVWPHSRRGGSTRLPGKTESDCHHDMLARIATPRNLEGVRSDRAFPESAVRAGNRVLEDVQEFPASHVGPK